MNDAHTVLSLGSRLCLIDAALMGTGMCDIQVTECVGYAFKSNYINTIIE